MVTYITHETLWIIIGFIGQAMFFMRFFVQWLASEKAKASVIPHTFWYFSIGGGLTLLAYALFMMTARTMPAASCPGMHGRA